MVLSDYQSSPHSPLPPSLLHSPHPLFDRFNSRPWHHLLPFDTKPANLIQEEPKNPGAKSSKVRLLSRSAFQSPSCLRQSFLQDFSSPNTFAIACTQHHKTSRMDGTFQSLGLNHSMLELPPALPPAALFPSCKAAVCQLLSLGTEP